MFERRYHSRNSVGLAVTLPQHTLSCRRCPVTRRLALARRGKAHMPPASYFDCLRTVASLYSMVPRDYAVSNDTGEQAHCVANAWSAHAAYVLASRTDRRCP